MEAGVVVMDDCGVGVEMSSKDWLLAQRNARFINSNPFYHVLSVALKSEISDESDAARFVIVSCLNDAHKKQRSVKPSATWIAPHVWRRIFHFLKGSKRTDPSAIKSMNAIITRGQWGECRGKSKSTRRVRRPTKEMERKQRHTRETLLKRLGTLAILDSNGKIVLREGELMSGLVLVDLIRHLARDSIDIIADVISGTLSGQQNYTSAERRNRRAEHAKWDKKALTRLSLLTGRDVVAITPKCIYERIRRDDDAYALVAGLISKRFSCGFAKSSSQKLTSDCDLQYASILDLVCETKARMRSALDEKIFREK